MNGKDNIKEVKMNSVSAGHEEVKQHRLSYEELNQACAEMSQSIQQQHKYIQQLHKQIQEMDIIVQTKRLDYLFKVVELAQVPTPLYHFDGDFVSACISEIQKSITIPEEQEKEESKEN